MLREYPSEMTYNAIFIVSSLEEHQVGTTRRIVEDLELYARATDIYLEVKEPKTADEFRAFFVKIRGMMLPGVGAILHLDMHGSIDKGVRIAGSNEFISWAELSRMCATLNLYIPRFLRFPKISFDRTILMDSEGVCWKTASSTTRNERTAFGL